MNPRCPEITGPRDGGGAARRGRPILSWRRTLRMSWANVRNRLGRSFLTFLGIAVVSAFFMSSFCYQRMVDAIAVGADVHARAALERAGVFAHDPESAQRQRDRRVWLMALSVAVCATGIANTILMSVTERVREIGALKCLGALDGFIVRLFLIENLFLGALGSAVGALFGYILAILQVGFTLEFGLISAGSCLRCLAAGGPIAVGAGTALTVAAAIYPTYVAAKMKPVDAMRSEV
ncbi:MAG: hypothetical protein NTW86_00535 [Candidatus Sumerlaeota bacterium]|nr:hypothetical protein [Candidatus Sumerlaeota bacterium]